MPAPVIPPLPVTLPPAVLDDPFVYICTVIVNRSTHCAYRVAPAFAVYVPPAAYAVPFPF